MSATTEPKRAKKLHPLVHHATKPHGLLIIGALVFLVGWFAWTFWIAAAVGRV